MARTLRNMGLALRPRHVTPYSAPGPNYALTSVGPHLIVTPASGKRIVVTSAIMGNESDFYQVWWLVYSKVGNPYDTKRKTFTLPFLGGIAAVNLIETEFIGDVDDSLYLWRHAGGGTPYKLYPSIDYFEAEPVI